MSHVILFLFFSHLYNYPPDSQKTDKGANTQGKQLPRPVFGDAKILLSARNFFIFVF